MQEQNTQAQDVAVEKQEPVNLQSPEPLAQTIGTEAEEDAQVKDSPEDTAAEEAQ